MKDTRFNIVSWVIHQRPAVIYMLVCVFLIVQTYLIFGR